MSKHTIKLDQVILVKLPNGEKFYLEYFRDGLLICPKDKTKKMKMVKCHDGIIIYLK
jgi:hypothetical protein